MNKFTFDLEQYKTFIKNNFSTPYENEDGSVDLLCDTYGLINLLPNNLGHLSEDEAIEYFYENKVIEPVMELIRKERSK